MLFLTSESKECIHAYHVKGAGHHTCDIREKAGLLPHTEVTFEFDGNSVRILPGKPTKKPSRGAMLWRDFAAAEW
jgi:hypothetical protein